MDKCLSALVQFALLTLISLLASCVSLENISPMPEVPAVGPAFHYTGFIRASGRNLVDESGRIFFIRGIGLGNWLLPEGYMWKFDSRGADRPRRIEQIFSNLLGKEEAEAFWEEFRENYIGEEDVRRMAETGFNTARLGINYRVLMSDIRSSTPVFLESGFRHIDDLISWGKKYGVYVVIDLHGAPGGQTGSKIDDSLSDKPELYTDEIYRTACINLWKEIARRYKDETQVLAYDLLNEPIPNSFFHLKQELEPFYREAVAAIRTIDPDHLITLEGADWAKDWSVFGKPFDSNLIYQFHKYWNGTNRYSVAEYLQFRELHQVPIWCGESGENESSWYRENFAMLEADAIGWAFWPWKNLDSDNCPYSINLPSDWYKLVEFTNSGKGCTPLEARAILTEYLDNIRISYCRYNPETMAAIFQDIPRENSTVVMR